MQQPHLREVTVYADITEVRLETRAASCNQLLADGWVLLGIYPLLLWCTRCSRCCCRGSRPRHHHCCNYQHPHWQQAPSGGQSSRRERRLHPQPLGCKNRCRRHSKTAT